SRLLLTRTFNETRDNEETHRTPVRPGAPSRTFGQQGGAERGRLSALQQLRELLRRPPRTVGFDRAVVHGPVDLLGDRIGDGVGAGGVEVHAAPGPVAIEA